MAGRKNREEQEEAKSIVPLPATTPTPLTPTPDTSASSIAASTPSPATSAPAPSVVASASTSATVDEVMRNRLKNATVVVAVKLAGQEASIGSGFFISEDGLIVTNHHVIEGAFLTGRLSVRLYNASEDVDGALCVAYDERRDIALLRVPGLRAPSMLDLYGGGRVPETTPVIVVGHPHEEYWSITLGAITAYREFKGQAFYGTDARIEPGNSGGPVMLRSNGEVVGISDWKIRASNMNYAIPVEVLAEFVRAEGNAPAKPCGRWGAGRE